jgi:AbiU2
MRAWVKRLLARLRDRFQREPSRRTGTTPATTTAAADALWQKWKEQLDTIRRQTYRAHHYRNLWRGLGEIIENANLPDSAFFGALRDWYADSQVSSIRRQLDTGRKSISLRNLLEDIARNPTVASRERHVAVWLEDDANPRVEHDANTNFDRLAGGQGRTHMHAAVVRADIEELQAAGAVAERYAHEVVAHTAITPTHEIPTYADLNDAIDQIGALVKKYSSLLEASIVAQLEPEILGDWRAPFRQPWIAPEEDE